MPPKVVSPKIEPIVPESEIDKIQKELDGMIKQFGQRSNIPINHPFWELERKLQTLHQDLFIKNSSKKE
jgi:hypothetical protein